MIRIRDISLPPEQSPDTLRDEVARLLRIPAGKIRSFRLVRRSVDARKKPNVRLIYTVDISVDGNEQKLIKNCKKASQVEIKGYQPPFTEKRPAMRPIVVGFGPAGMFAALILAQAGLRPLVLERGEDAVTRHKKVEHFFVSGELDTKSNVQFGEGGAGTFSDGKLNTGVNNPRISWILEQFVRFGAREEILYDAKPHVGTDVLLQVVQNIRAELLRLGGEVRFCTQVTDLRQDNGVLTGLQINNQEWLDCDRAIFALGHSARDTFQTLQRQGIPMVAKSFAMGVRIEHLQEDIDAAQYGAANSALPPADYKLVCHLDEDTVYTFCMCPGGYVVAAASEEGRCVTNGMSYVDRAGRNANAALLVTVTPKDFPSDDPLAGMYWQQRIEEAAYQAAGGGYRAPAQLVGDFLTGKASVGPGKVTPTYRPGVTWCDLHQVLPQKITDALKTALPRLDGTLRDFASPDSVLTAPETRSSSPVRLLRGDNKQSIGLQGLFPAGEGAGYAGGIMSAAIDGILCAEALLESL